jgi:tetratricopeptide (TPR) repeat protein
MKRFITWIVFSSLFVAPLARADGPDDQYVTIYNLISQADGLNDKGQIPEAMAKYAEAESALKRFQMVYPDWNLKVVKFRLKYLDGKIAQLSAQAAASNAAATNASTAMLAQVPPVPPTAPIPPVPPTAPVPPVSPTEPVPPVPPSAPVPPVPPSEPVPPVPPTTPVPPQSNAMQPGISAEAEKQIKSLQDQISGIETDRALLQAKLKEALSAQPAAVDPQEFAKAQEQIRDLQKENELLKATLAEHKKSVPATPAAVPVSGDLQQQLAESGVKLSQLTEANARLVSENETLQARVQSLTTADSNVSALRDENAILKKQVAELQEKSPAASSADDLDRKLKQAQAQLAASQSDQEVLKAENLALKAQARQMTQAPAPGTNTEPVSLAVLDSVTASKIAQLESQRDELHKSLDALTKDVYGRKKGKETAALIDDMTRQLAGLRARIEIFETREVPYAPEELALLSQPDNVLAASAHNGSRKAPKELPASAAVTLAEAKRAYVAHDFQQAESKYLEVLKLDEKNIDTLADLASIQIELGKMDEAEKNLKTALAIEPNDDYSLFVLGQLKFKEKSYDEALDALGRAAELNPLNPKVQNFLGLTLSEKGLRGPAETAFRKAIQFDPGFAEAHLNLAVVYISQDPPLVELARWHYQKALAAGHPPSPDVEKMLNASRAVVPTASSQ